MPLYPSNGAYVSVSTGSLKFLKRALLVQKLFVQPSCELQLEFATVICNDSFTLFKGTSPLPCMLPGILRW